jgi:hypothetical protein
MAVMFLLSACRDGGESVFGADLGEHVVLEAVLNGLAGFPFLSILIELAFRDLDVQDVQSQVLTARPDQGQDAFGSPNFSRNLAKRCTDVSQPPFAVITVPLAPVFFRVIPYRCYGFFSVPW